MIVFHTKFSLKYFLLTICGCLANASLNAQTAPPPPQVSYIVAKSQAVTVSEDLPARLQASREAIVRAQISGIVQKRMFQEGSYVKAGEQLYQIDDAPYRAGLQTAKASLQQAQAQRELAQSTVARYEPLVKAKAISKQQYDQAKSQVLLAKANIEAANAAILQAQINVDYAQVKAPIAGFVGHSVITEGALVNAMQGSEMTTIRQLDPMYVNIKQSASQVMSLRRAIDSGSLRNNSQQPEIDIILEDGSIYPHKAKLLFADQSVDPSSGEILLRATVANPQRILLPGLYVRVKMPQAVYDNAFLIPQQAVTRGNDKSTLMIVNSDNSILTKVVQIARAQGSDWVVVGGLQNGEKVIVEGSMSLMFGAKKVTPVPFGASDKKGSAAKQ